VFRRNGKTENLPLFSKLFHARKSRLIFDEKKDKKSNLEKKFENRGRFPVFYVTITHLPFKGKSIGV